MNSAYEYPQTYNYKGEMSMKRFLAIALALMMVISIAPVAAVADEAIASEPAEVKKYSADDYAYSPTAITVNEKYFALAYKMHYASEAGTADVEASQNPDINQNDNGCCGLVITDNAVVYLPHDGVNSDSTKKTANGQLRFGPWWSTPNPGTEQSNDVSRYKNTDVTILILGEVSDDKTSVTVRTYFNGVLQTAWGGQTTATVSSFAGKVGWCTSLTGIHAEVDYSESGSNVFDAATFNNSGTYTATGCGGDTESTVQSVITKKYFAAAYTIDNFETKGGTAGVTGDNGCCGILINGGQTAFGAIYFPYFGLANTGTVVFGPWWNYSTENPDLNKMFGAWTAVDISSLGGSGDVTLLVLGEVDGTTVKFSTYINGNLIQSYGADVATGENFAGTIGWSTKLTGKEATFKFAQRDSSAYDTSVFAESIDGTIGKVNGGWTEGADGRSFTSKTGDLGSARGSYYQLGSGTEYELTATVGVSSQAGFLIGAKDTNGNGYIDEVGDKYVLIDVMHYSDTNKWELGVELNNASWGGWTVQKELTTTPENNTVTLKAVVSGGKVSVYVDSTLICEVDYSSVVTDDGKAEGFGLWTKDASTSFTNVRAAYILDAVENGSNFKGFYQTRANASGTDLRLTVEGLDANLKDCKSLSFKITFTSNSEESSKTVDYPVTKAYKQLDESGTYVAYKAADGAHLVGCIITGIPSTVTNISVTAVFTNTDGTTTEYLIGSGILA